MVYFTEINPRCLIFRAERGKILIGEFIEINIPVIPVNIPVIPVNIPVNICFVIFLILRTINIKLNILFSFFHISSRYSIEQREKVVLFYPLYNSTAGKK